MMISSNRTQNTLLWSAMSTWVFVLLSTWVFVLYLGCVKAYFVTFFLLKIIEWFLFVRKLGGGGGARFSEPKKNVSLFEKCVKVLRTECVKINMSSLLKVKTYVNKSGSLFYIGLHWHFVFLLRIWFTYFFIIYRKICLSGEIL